MIVAYEELTLHGGHEVFKVAAAIYLSSIARLNWQRFTIVLGLDVHLVLITKVHHLVCLAYFKYDVARIRDVREVV